MKVFISYAHEDDAHRARVLKLAQDLRRDGVGCELDQFLNGSPPEGWPLWMERQIEAADVVLIVGGPGYIRRYELRDVEEHSFGGIWEGAIVRSDLYLAAGRNNKFIPVIFDGSPLKVVPKPLRPYNCYRIPDDYEKLLRVLTAQRPILPEPIGPVRVLPSAKHGAFNIRTHRLALETRAKTLDWWNHAIPLDVASAATNKISEARNVLESWLNTSTYRHCIVLGDPGAGKTGLLWWTALMLAKQESAVPIFVSASKLRLLEKVTFSDLGRIAEPSLSILSQSELGESQLYLILDGLDELVGAEAGGDRVALELLTMAFAVLPPSSRVIAACRTPAFAIIDRELKSALPNNAASSGAADLYDRAIIRALGLSDDAPLILHVKPVSQNHARAFLEERSVADNLIHTAITSSNILPFLSSPFSLRLLTLALPHLIKQKSIAIDDLYRIYVRAALLREDSSLNNNELEVIVAQLRGMVFMPRSKMDPKFQSIAQKAGLILKKGDRFEFSHYSLWEYFFASELLIQISNYDSRTLARLDLVSGYNINRMLLPMMRRMIDRKADPSFTEIRPVSASEYRNFAEIRGWRKQTGYGIHPSMLRSSDGTPSATFSVGREEALSVHHDHRHGNEVACALSWYDAAVFAMHAGTRIPTSIEIPQIDYGGDYLFWCADWHNEEIAHVCLYNTRTREIYGANPDVRLSKTALAVIGRAGS